MNYWLSRHIPTNQQLKQRIPDIGSVDCYTWRGQGWNIIMFKAMSDGHVVVDLHGYTTRDRTYSVPGSFHYSMLDDEIDIFPCLLEVLEARLELLMANIGTSDI